jgi:zinc transporter ZupT
MLAKGSHFILQGGYMVPVWLEAGLWGTVAGLALVLGAAAGFYLRLPQRVIAGVTAFGSGVLISALAFEMMDKAYERGGIGFDSQTKYGSVRNSRGQLTSIARLTFAQGGW